MSSWQTVWRNGIAPSLKLDGLLALKGALERDDHRLALNATTMPPPLMCVQDWPVESADAITWTGWRGGENPDIQTVGQAEAYFARICFECDERMGEPAAIRWFLHFWDDGPKADVVAELLAEVNLELERQEHAWESWKEDQHSEGEQLVATGHTDEF